jgi:hypothetical protein
VARPRVGAGRCGLGFLVLRHVALSGSGPTPHGSPPVGRGAAREPPAAQARWGAPWTARGYCLTPTGPAERVPNRGIDHVFDLAPGQIVTWQPGPKNPDLPDLSQPMVVREPLDEPLDGDGAATDGAGAFEHLDVIGGWLDDEDLLAVGYPTALERPSTPGCPLPRTNTGGPSHRRDRTRDQRRAVNTSMPSGPGWTSVDRKPVSASVRHHCSRVKSPQTCRSCTARTSDPSRSR